MARVNCSDCKNLFPIGITSCPHCGRPSIFPNVQLASSKVERSALDKRFRAAQAFAKKQGKPQLIQEIKHICEEISVCRGLPAAEVMRLAINEASVAQTYLKQLSSGTVLPNSDEWESFRKIAGEYLHAGFKEDITYAALTSKGDWLRNYGSAAIIFNKDMIAHRVTVFEGNSAKMIKGKAVALEMNKFPPGMQATWKDRYKLIISKIIGKAVEDVDISHLILCNSSSTEDDDFIEAHIFGKYTFRSLSEIKITRGSLTKGDLSLLKIKAEELGIDVLEVSR